MAVLRFFDVLSAVVVITCLLLARVEFSDDILAQVPVHRAIMVDYKDEKLGSRTDFLRGELGFPQFNGKDDLSLYKGRPIVIPCVELGSDTLKELAALPIRGMVVENCLDAPQRDTAISQLLLSSAVEFPVFFLSRLDNVVTNNLRMTASLDGTGSRRFVAKISAEAVQTTPPKKLHTISVKGTLQHTKPTATPVSRIILSAHFDTLGVSPSTPSTSNIYAAPAVLEVWRRLSATQNVAASEPFSVTAVLGTTSKFGFAGTKRWIQEEVSHTKFSLAISVEELLPPASEWDGRSDRTVPPLYMHVHKSYARTEDGAELIAKVQEAAKAAGVAVEVLPSRTRYHHHDLLWEHEAFAHYGIPAVTFSSLRAHQSPVATQPDVLPGNPFHPESIDLVVRRIDFLHRVVEAVTGLRHDSEAQWLGSARYVEGLGQFVSHAVRTSPSLYAVPPEVPQQEHVAAELSKALSAANPLFSFHSSVAVVSAEVPYASSSFYPSTTQVLVVYQGFPWEYKVILLCGSALGSLLLVSSRLLRRKVAVAETKKVA